MTHTASYILGFLVGGIYLGIGAKRMDEPSAKLSILRAGIILVGIIVHSTVLTYLGALPR